MSKFNLKETELEIRLNADGTFSTHSEDAALMNYYHATALVVAVDFFEVLKQTMLNMYQDDVKVLRIKCTWEKE